MRLLHVVGRLWPDVQARGRRPGRRRIFIRYDQRRELGDLVQRSADRLGLDALQRRGKWLPEARIRRGPLQPAAVGPELPMVGQGVLGVGLRRWLVHMLGLVLGICARPSHRLVQRQRRLDARRTDQMVRDHPHARRHPIAHRLRLRRVEGLGRGHVCRRRAVHQGRRLHHDGAVAHPVQAADLHAQGRAHGVFQRDG